VDNLVLGMKNFGVLLLLYGTFGLLLATLTIDIQPMGLIVVKVPSGLDMLIYTLFNPIATMLPYITRGADVSIWNPLVMFVAYGYPMFMILLGIFLTLAPKNRRK